jgi:uncharacterized membrane protein YgdD (TMEM256/DUF423 family)
MHKKLIALAAFIAGLAVALGAFGAHGLQKITTDEKILHGYQTAVQYQMYHALALLSVGIFYFQLSGRWMKWVATFFIAGIILFSGSLYLITLLKIQESDAVKYAGPVTPLGGLFLITGWIILMIAAIKKSD